jgi:transcriptional regulator with XRE-family HTH domain
MKSTQQIVSRYRKSKKLSLRKFAAVLVENIQGESLSYMTVKNWEDGINTPDFSFLMTLALKCRDWRGDFAFDCLAAIKPNLYQPASAIGREILQTE